jgi:hypothetical protein
MSDPNGQGFIIMSNANMPADKRRSATIIWRDGTDLHGLRHVTDDAAALSVRAFPFADVAAAVARGGFATAGAYLLVGNDAAYVGESGNLGRRLQEHALDPGKAFATEIYAVSGFDRRLDKAAAVHMQMRLSARVEAAGAVRLVKGNNPCTADLPAWRVATLDRMIDDALRLLFDGGCRCLTTNPQPPASVAAPPVMLVAPVTGGEEDDDGPMEVGVTTVPLGVEELELAFGGLWARGYEHDDQFVVAAGSELRKNANPSITENTLTRRNRLVDTSTVAAIPGVDDRLRLKLAVAFPSRAIAAKVLCGAHVGSDKWRPLRAAAPVIVAA